MPHEPDGDQRRALIERLRLLSEIDSTQTALFHQAAAATYGLHLTDMKALSILLREGPQTAGSLMHQLNVTSGAVTGVINRLVAHRLAHREVNPEDRRKVTVRVDQDVLSSRQNVYSPIGAAFDRLYADYSTAELHFLARYLEAATEITRQQTQALKQQEEQVE